MAHLAKHPSLLSLWDWYNNTNTQIPGTDTAENKVIHTALLF